MIFFNKSLVLVAIAVASALYSCGSDKGGEESPQQNEQEQNPEPEPESEKGEEYVIVQKRSSKRGLCASFSVAGDIALLAPGASWFYNWGPDLNAGTASLATAHDMVFYPMAWNGSYDQTRVKAFKKAHPECEYLLAFNEPNLTDQANMTPEEAASHWPALKQFADEVGLKLISPAMNYGTLSGYGDPVKWLDEFFAQPGVSIDDVEGIALHSYMATAAGMKDYINRFDKYGKPIWLTEFCAWENHVTEEFQKNFMVSTISYLENEPKVAKYAWFMERSGGATVEHPYFDLTIKATPNELSELGEIFVYMSTFDKETYYSQGQTIPAESYSAANLTASGVGGVSVRRSTDTAGPLEVYNFTKGNWVEYLVDVPTAGSYSLTVRYAAKGDATWDIATPAGETTVPIAATGGETEWQTVTIDISLASGRQTLRLNPVAGNCVLNWLKII
jgi:hypothetical protein